MGGSICNLVLLKRPMPDQSLPLSTTDLVESWMTRYMADEDTFNARWNTLAKFASKLFANQTALVVLVMLTKIVSFEEWLPDPTIGCMCWRVMWTMWNLSSETLWSIHFMKSNLSGQPDHCDQSAWSRDLSRRITYFVILTWFRPKSRQSGTKWSIDPNFQLIALMCPNNHRI